MTSQQDTELREILQDFILVYVLDEQKHLSRPETKTKEWFDSQFEDTMNEAIAVLTSWKDKEVQKAKLRLINTEIRKLQKNEVWYRFDDCVWELKQTRKRITKSLQSQGGKMVQIKERKGE